MSFFREDISLTNALQKWNTDVLQFKNQNKVVDSSKVDPDFKKQNQEEVNLSDDAFNEKIKVNGFIEENQKDYNILEKYEQSLLKYYNYLEEMKKILEENLEESKNKALKSWQELNFSVNDFVEKTEEESKQILIDKNKKDKDKEKTSLKDLSLDSFDNISVKNSDDAIVLVDKIKITQNEIKDNINVLSDKKGRIEKETNNIIKLNSGELNKFNPEKINDLIKSVTNNILKSPSETIGFQIKNLNEKINLPLLGY